MDQVTDRLWIGAEEDGKDWATLQAKGVTAVVNLAQITDGWTVEQKDGIPYVRLDQADGAEISDATFDRFLAFCKQTGLDGRVLLVHCGAGVSRAATFTIVWLMWVNPSWTWNRAEAAVKSVRDKISPNAVLVESALQHMRARPHEFLNPGVAR